MPVSGYEIIKYLKYEEPPVMNPQQQQQQQGQMFQYPQDKHRSDHIHSGNLPDNLLGLPGILFSWQHVELHRL